MHKIKKRPRDENHGIYLFGSLHESLASFTLRKVEKNRTDPSVGRSRVREAAPAAMPQPTEAREGCAGLVGEACRTAVHTSSTASSTADDHHTLDGDANVCRER